MTTKKKDTKKKKEIKETKEKVKEVVAVEEVVDENKTVEEEPKVVEETIVIEESKDGNVVEVKINDEEINEDISKPEEEKIEEEKVVETVIEKDSNETVEDVEDDELLEEDYDSLNIWEKFVKFENDTKIGVTTGIFLLISNPLLLNFDWVNHSRIIIIILAFMSLRYLNKQRLELEEDKPFEAKFANISFIVVIVLLVVRDLAITSRLSDLSEIFTK